MSVPKTISFSELVQGRDASVRVTEDGLIYAVDLVMVMTGKNQHDSAKVIRDLSEDRFKQVFLLLFPSKNVEGKNIPFKKC